MFEPLLAQLATVESPEAEALMAQALEAYDSIGTCQQLHTDVIEARQTMQSTGGDGEGFAPAAPPPPAAPPAAAPLPVAQASAAGQDPFDMLGLGELQMALETSQAPAAQTVDPFAYPTQQQQPPPQQQQEQWAPSASNADDPFASAAAAPSAVDDDPFLALATGGGTVPAHEPQPAPVVGHSNDPHHLSPDALLADLTKSPHKPIGAPSGTAMRAAPAPPTFSANNPFAEPAPAAEPPQQQQQPAIASQNSVDDEWDMFFKDRVTSPPTAAAPASGPPAVQTADAFDALVMQ
uniref:GAT domain-containing protein n=2 Tax=Tetraselmis chuii TaxID=63592 RepID=A0A7S1SK17_9CHLO|mmetsp:Transcript_16441/g.29327  ORF Transcript_16441/g.29327 Transcript_16441/m.29327 type:complete len:293 (+) Transcript_16441:410-1288(+)